MHFESLGDHLYNYLKDLRVKHQEKQISVKLQNLSNNEDEHAIYIHYSKVASISTKVVNSILDGI